MLLCFGYSSLALFSGIEGSEGHGEKRKSDPSKAKLYVHLPQDTRDASSLHMSRTWPKLPRLVPSNWGHRVPQGGSNMLPFSMLSDPTCVLPCQGSG